MMSKHYLPKLQTGIKTSFLLNSSSFKPDVHGAWTSGDPHRPLPCSHPVRLHGQWRCFWGVLFQQLTLRLSYEFNWWTFLGLYVQVRPGVSGAEQFGLPLLVNIIGYHQHNSSPLYWIYWSLAISLNLVELHESLWSLQRICDYNDLCDR